jgi:hypothetical protein
MERYRELGRIKWFGGYNYQLMRDNDYGFIERVGKSDLYVNKKNILCDELELKDGIPVTFYVEENNHNYKRNQAIELKLIRDETEIKILKECFFKPEIFYQLPASSQLYKLLPDDEIIDLLDEYFSSNKNSLFYYPSYNLMLSSKAKHIRSMMPKKELLKLFTYSSSIDDYYEEIYECELIVSSRSWLNFCSQLENKIDYDSNFYPLLPDEIKSKKIKKKFEKFLFEIDQCTISPKTNIDWTPKKIYYQLRTPDYKIAKIWGNVESITNNDIKKSVFAKMLSARAAEIAVKNFYKSIGYEIEDISIHQLHSSSQDWITHDLLLNGEIPIDVKNSRNPVNHKYYYVDYCIPKFKFERRLNNNVKIAGVLSPYLQSEYIVNPKEINYYVKSIVFLGEFEVRLLQNIKKIFSNDNISLKLSKSNLYPPWLFDFPITFYQNQIDSREAIRIMEDNEIPSQDEVTLFDYNPIPGFLSAKRKLSLSFKKSLLPWQIKLFDQIIEKSEYPITLPYLYLNIITHFLHIISSDKEYDNFHPEGYRKLLYADHNSNKNLKKYSTPSRAHKSYHANNFGEEDLRPIGILDPLNIISELIDTLEILWENKNQISLTEFQDFKFRGFGILEGRKFHENRYTTILAYCGGTIERKGKCGNKPLIIGREKTCPSCRKLICNKCGFCSNDCPNYIQRLKDIQDKRISIDRDEDSIPF